MPISRFLASSLRNRSGDCVNLLRQRLGSSRRVQCRSYSGAPKNNKQKLDTRPLVTEQPLKSHSSSLTKFIIPTGLLAIVGAGIFVHYNDEKRVVLKGQEGARKLSCECKGPTVGGPFNLIDTELRSVTERNFRGNWVLLYFGYTSSPDVGPEEVEKMAKAINILESKQELKIIPAFVTIDPERDSPKQLKTYLNEFDPRIVGLTGPVGAVKDMAREYRIFFRKVEEDGADYLVQTSHHMYLLDPNLEIARCFGLEYTAEQLSDEILKLINSRPK
ncbi:hypothetical protein MKW94_001411 [Papaver nudicaule]|uniref:Uncharacterized protein n=1 Tax=Papaver nudicaule TaxID=74823 RepID=A0AA41VHB1_PAPNU|nr:hypothetical protein [Papaver nudicaule]